MRNLEKLQLFCDIFIKFYNWKLFEVVLNNCYFSLLVAIFGDIQSKEIFLICRKTQMSEMHRLKIRKFKKSAKRRI